MQDAVAAPYDRDAALIAIDRHKHERGALLPMLHAIVETIGFVPDDLVPDIAEALNLSRADVHGVVTFYHDFRRAPAGRHVVKFCRAEACQARGARELEPVVVEALGTAMNSTSERGNVTLEATYCLGLCATGPSALVDGRPVARLDRAKLERIAAQVAA